MNSVQQNQNAASGQSQKFAQLQDRPETRMESINSRLAGQVNYLAEIRGRFDGALDELHGITAPHADKHTVAAVPAGLIGQIEQQIENMAVVIEQMNDLSHRFSSL